MNQFPDPNRWLVSFGWVLFLFSVMKFIEFFFFFVNPAGWCFFDCIIVSLIFYSWGAEGGDTFFPTLFPFLGDSEVA